MSPKIMLVAICILLGFGYAGFDLLRAPNTSLKADIDAANLQKQTIQDFAFTDIDSIERNLHDFKGKVIILNFWASWCAPCVKEFPDMLELAAQEDIIFLAISADEKKENMQRFIKRLAPQKLALENVVIAFDKDKAISLDLFQTAKYPETFIIAPDLTIREKIVGFTDWLSDDIRALLQ